MKLLLHGSFSATAKSVTRVLSKDLLLCNLCSRPRTAALQWSSSLGAQAYMVTMGMQELWASGPLLPRCKAQKD